MLSAVNGYIDGNKVIVNENITSWQGRNVIVTILDSLKDSTTGIKANIDNQEKRISAAKEIAGLWESHDNTLSVEDSVREMRRGRRFDN